MLASMLPQIESDVALAPRSTLGVGGAAQYFARVTTVSELAAALAWAKKSEQAVRILGGGSNIVVADAGVAGLVVEIALRGLEFREHGEEVEIVAAAGESWDELVAQAVTRGLSGIECLSGIPGRVGATPVQNVGAYGQEVKDSISRVDTFDRLTHETKDFSPAECRFAYRDSCFKSEAPERFVITAVHYRLRRNGKVSVRYPELEARLAAQGSTSPSLGEVRNAVLELRRAKSMLLEAGEPNARSCGSFFVNPILTRAAAESIAERVPATTMPRYPQADGGTKLSAAWLIEQAGFVRGTRAGSVGLSSRHALAVVAHDGARAEDIVRFAAEVRAAVFARFGVCLVPEPEFWGFAEMRNRFPDLP
jgi:UDP-N-acetylmuramate dehydrogenase